MAFFPGTPDGKGAHDAMAEQISNHTIAKELAVGGYAGLREYITSSLLLPTDAVVPASFWGYARLSSLDREKITYKM